MKLSRLFAISILIGILCSVVASGSIPPPPVPSPCNKPGDSCSWSMASMSWNPLCCRTLASNSYCRQVRWRQVVCDGGPPDDPIHYGYGYSQADLGGTYTCSVDQCVP